MVSLWVEDPADGPGGILINSVCRRGEKRPTDGTPLCMATGTLEEARATAILE